LKELSEVRLVWVRL